MVSLIPVLSLVVAALAVFFGPMLSLHVARRQVTSSLEVANKQITAPMRQAWINSLRDLLAELTSVGIVAVPEDQTHAATRLDRMTHLQYKILLMLNPKEQDHLKLEQSPLDASAPYGNERRQECRRGTQECVRHGWPGCGCEIS